VRYFVTVGGETLELEVERSADGTSRVRDAAGREVTVTSLFEQAGAHTLSIAGQVIEVRPREAEVTFAQERFSVRAESERERATAEPAGSAARGSRELRAPMPGRIVRVSCTPGQTVHKGTPLIVMEAMKMQNELCAKADQTVRAVHVSSGDSVDRGALLLDLE
jgi:biotin carboxyl carrier protein